MMPPSDHQDIRLFSALAEAKTLHSLHSSSVCHPLQVPRSKTVSGVRVHQQQGGRSCPWSSENPIVKQITNETGWGSQFSTNVRPILLFLWPAGLPSPPPSVTPITPDQIIWSMCPSISLYTFITYIYISYPYTMYVCVYYIHLYWIHVGAWFYDMITLLDSFPLSFPSGRLPTSCAGPALSGAEAISGCGP